MAGGPQAARGKKGRYMRYMRYMRQGIDKRKNGCRPLCAPRFADPGGVRFLPLAPVPGKDTTSEIAHPLPRAIGRRVR